MRKQKMDLSEKATCQDKLKKIITKLIKNSGITTVEYQLDYLRKHPDMKLPTRLNYKETIRMYELSVEDYKKDYSKKNYGDNK